MIAREAIKILRRKEIVPKISKLEAKSFEELTKLRIKQVQWNGTISIEILLNDGQACQAGLKFDVNK